LAEEFRDVDLLRSGIRRGGVDARELGDGIQERSDVLRCTPEGEG